MPQSYVLQFIGGLAFFFYGLFSIHEGLNFFAGDRFKNIIARTTAGRFKSLFTGMVATFFLQSSSAVTVMMVGLTSSGLISLEKAMAMALGAGIGTTFVVLIISIKSIVEYGLMVIVIGLVTRFVSSRRVLKIAGDIILGFGFLFFGLTFMSQATEPLKAVLWIPNVIDVLQDYPFANFVVAGLITALVHSSSVILGILISLAYAGLITFEAAFPLILGANVGTALTAILVSFKARTDGKRAAWANFFLRFGTVLLIYPFLKQFIYFTDRLNTLILVDWLHQTVTVQWEIAFCHFFFNLFVAVIFLPLLPLGKNLICWLIPAPMNEEQVFGPKYLDKNALSTPSLAFTQVIREMTRMGEIVLRMFHDVLMLFKKYDLDFADEIRASDHKVDILYKAIKFYLARMSFHNIKEKESEMSIHLMTAVNELENMGDTIDRHLARLAHKKYNKGVQFSEEGWQEICEMHQATQEMLELALAALSTSNSEIAQKMKSHQAFYANRENKLKRSHLLRLHQGLKESIDTSAIHLEMLAIFSRINLSLLVMVRYLLTDKPQTDDEEYESTNH